METPPIVAGPGAAETPEARRSPARRSPRSTRPRRRATQHGEDRPSVQAERLDELMDRVGELVIAQARLTQIAAASTDGNRQDRSPRRSSASPSGLRDTTMGVRMVPIGIAVRPLPPPGPRPVARSRQADRAHHHRRGDRTRQDHDRAARRSAGPSHPQRHRPRHRGPRRAAPPPASRTSGRIGCRARYSGAEVLVTVTDDGARPRSPRASAPRPRSRA